jgi:hypothetical protein
VTLVIEHAALELYIMGSARLSHEAGRLGSINSRQALASGGVPGSARGTRRRGRPRTDPSALDQLRKGVSAGKLVVRV